MYGQLYIAYHKHIVPPAIVCSAKLDSVITARLVSLRPRRIPQRFQRWSSVHVQLRMGSRGRIVLFLSVRRSERQCMMGSSTCYLAESERAVP